MDARIAAYVVEVSMPGVPWISTSHNTLVKLYGQHGRETIDALLAAHWAAERAADLDRPKANP